MGGRCHCAQGRFLVDGDRSTAVLACYRAILLAALPAVAQYPGQVAKAARTRPSCAPSRVLEWTGEAGKPKASRLVPVAVLDGGELQDGGIYLARPEPLALAGEVEYELQQNGKPIGLFDIKNAGQEQGSWVGYGAWKPLPVAKPKPSAAGAGRSRRSTTRQATSRSCIASITPTSARRRDDRRPAARQTGSAAPAPAATPTGPHCTRRLQRQPATPARSPAPAPPTDPDRPTLHKKASSDDATSGTAPADDPDRPALKKSKKKQPEDIGHVDSLPEVTDPDRPRLKRGKSSGDGLERDCPP